MENARSVRLPMSNKEKEIDDGEPFPDITLYSSLEGALQYLTITRPDLTFVVGQIYQYMHAPTTKHFNILKKLIRYVNETVNLGMKIIHATQTKLTVFSDADWAGYPLTKRSTTGMCVFFGSNCISWGIRKQKKISKSSTEAEYRAMFAATAEITWITHLLRDLGVRMSETPQIFCDNLSALQLTINPKFHKKSKHFKLDFHYIREKVAQEQLVSRFIRSEEQVVDLFTKPVDITVLEKLKTKIGLINLKT